MTCEVRILSFLYFAQHAWTDVPVAGGVNKLRHLSLVTLSYIPLDVACIIYALSKLARYNITAPYCAVFHLRLTSQHQCKSATKHRLRIRVTTVTLLFSLHGIYGIPPVGTVPPEPCEQTPESATVSGQRAPGIWDPEVLVLPLEAQPDWHT